MSHTISENKVFQILWQSVEGGQYDLDDLKRSVGVDTNIAAFLDSLDMADFLLRLEHHYKIGIPQEEYPRLSSIAAIEAYIRDRAPAMAGA
jgi:acyl carrier protein